MRVFRTPPPQIRRQPFFIPEESLFDYRGIPSLISDNHSIWSGLELTIDDTYLLLIDEILDLLKKMPLLKSLTIKKLPALSPQIWEGIAKLHHLETLKIKECKGVFSDPNQLPELPLKLRALELQDIGITLEKANWAIRQLGDGGKLLIASENLVDTDIAARLCSVSNLRLNMCYMTLDFVSVLSKSPHFQSIDAEDSDIESHPRWVFDLLPPYSPTLVRA